jgi:hypothetical protein
MTLDKRFWSKVDKAGSVPQERPDLGPCWIWTAALNKGGYGVFWLDGHMVLAYHLSFGPVEPGLERDHLCRVHACVRPDHIEAVTHQVNMARGVFGTRAHCPWNHRYTESNTHVTKASHRQCLICAAVRAYENRQHHRDPSKGNVMSKWDYEVAKKIEAENYPFPALIMAAMRKADSANASLLQRAWPETVAELNYRYWSAGGLMPGEDGYTAAGDDNLPVPVTIPGNTFPAMNS